MENSEQARGEQIGSMAGLGAGMMAGARVGSVVIPIPVVGTFLGAMLGGVLGSEVGKKLGAATLSAATAFMESLNTPTEQAAGEQSEATSEQKSAEEGSGGGA